MGDKKQNKTFIMVLIGIIGVCLITIGLTYAYWILTKQQTGENVVNTACLNITFTGENDITLDKAYPMKLEELETFLSKSTPFHFTIENTCDDLANATINLESLNAEAEKQLQDEYIDAILYETDYHTNLNIEKHLNESMYNDENKVISNSLHAYELYNFVLQKGETKSFNLLLYMDPNTPMVTANMNATWKGKITLSTSYKEVKLANLNGLKVPVVENGDGLYAVSHNVSEISSDWNKEEYRYAGANVNNYVSFNNEIWRIIGKVNVQADSGIEQRIKIIRQDGIEGQQDFGEYLYDVDNYTGNWGKASLKNILNDLYYTSSSGLCNKDNETKQVTCDFTVENGNPSGLNNEARSMIDSDVIWNAGTTDFDEFAEISSKKFYERERGSLADDDYPFVWSKENDPKSHNGIGLMYASDYGFAAGNDVRSKCLEQNLNRYYNNECHNNNWLYTENKTWTMSYDGTNYDCAFFIDEDGSIEYKYCGNVYSFQLYVDPVVYLKSSVKITENPQPDKEYGTIDNPFQLSQSGM